jgi:hypothetical protein
MGAVNWDRFLRSVLHNELHLPRVQYRQFTHQRISGLAAAQDRSGANTMTLEVLAPVGRKFFIELQRPARLVMRNRPEFIIPYQMIGIISEPAPQMVRIWYLHNLPARHED